MDGSLLATLTEDQVSVWDSEDYSLVRSYPIDFFDTPQYTFFVHFIDNNEYLLVDTPNLRSFLFELQSSYEQTEINIPGRVFPNVYANDIFVYDATSENPLTRFSISNLLNADMEPTFIYDSEIRYVNAINNVSGIVSISSDGNHFLIDQQGKILNILESPNSLVNLATFDASGRFLATFDRSRESKLTIWGLPNCES